MQIWNKIVGKSQTVKHLFLDVKPQKAGEWTWNHNRRESPHFHRHACQQKKQEWGYKMASTSVSPANTT